MILGKRPAVVALELPADFQGAIDSFLSGRSSEKRFLSDFGRMLGREVRIDRRILKAGEPPEYKRSDDAALYFVLAAKQVGAKVYAVDASFSSLKGEVEKALVAGKKGRGAAMGRAARSLHEPDPGYLTFAEFVHAPFHFFELVAGHHPEEGPGRHDPACRICRAGVSWERFFHSAYSAATNVLHPISEAKYVSALNAFDRLREAKIVDRLARLERFPPKGVRADGEKILIIHLWHAPAVEAGLRKLKIPVSSS